MKRNITILILSAWLVSAGICLADETSPRCDARAGNAGNKPGTVPAGTSTQGNQGSTSADRPTPTHS